MAWLSCLLCLDDRSELSAENRSHWRDARWGKASLAALSVGKLSTSSSIFCCFWPRIAYFWQAHGLPLFRCLSAPQISIVTNNTSITSPQLSLYRSNMGIRFTQKLAIDHRAWNTGLPVRSAVLKPCAGRLVVGWVTTSAYLLLIVFAVPESIHQLCFYDFLSARFGR